MARSARRGRSSSFRRRRPVDWVQNDITYSEQYTTLAPGQNNAAAGVLVHSAQVRREVIGAGNLPVSATMSAAIPQWNKRQVVRAVRGTIEMSPVETWSTSQVRHWGFRIAKFVEDMDAQLPMVPIDYNMYGLQPAVPAGDEREPYAYADDPFQWERRTAITYNAEVQFPILVIPVRWSGRVYLENDECFAIYMEGDFSQGDSGGVRVRTWLRSLCEIPD